MSLSQLRADVLERDGGCVWPPMREGRRGFGAFCRECGTWFIARVTNRKLGRDFYCGRGCSQRVNGRQFKGPPLRGSGKYVGGKNRQHRRIAEALLGRSLVTREHVHHVDGDKANNEPSNLVVVQAGDHQRLHAGKEVPCLDLQGRRCRTSGRRYWLET